MIVHRIKGRKFWLGENKYKVQKKEKIDYLNLTH